MSFIDKLDALLAEKGINKATLSKEAGIPYTTIAGFYTKGTDNAKLSLSDFESILNNFEAAEEGKQHLQDEKNKILDSIQNDIPYLIKNFSEKKLEQKLGFEQIDMSTAYFPKYIFQYVSSGGNASTQCDIVMDIDNLNKFVLFLSEKIKFNKSAAGQRALMTSKLRQHIKERDGFACKQCGVSIQHGPWWMEVGPCYEKGIQKCDQCRKAKVH